MDSLTQEKEYKICEKVQSTGNEISMIRKIIRPPERKISQTLGVYSN